MSESKEFYAIYDKGNKTYFRGGESAYEFHEDFTNALRFGTQMEADEYIMENYVPVDRFEVRRLVVRYEVQKIQQIDRVAQILRKFTRSELETLEALGVMKIDIDSVMNRVQEDKEVMYFGKTKLQSGLFNTALEEIFQMGTPGIKNLSFLSKEDETIASAMMDVEIHFTSRVFFFIKQGSELFRSAVPKGGITSEYSRSLLNTLFFLWYDGKKTFAR